MLVGRAQSGRRLYSDLAESTAQWYDPPPHKLPELPEIEHLKRTLEPHVLGASVLDAKLSRRDVFRNGSSLGRAACSRALLAGRRIAELRRHGKQLAIMSEDELVLCVHLGMSGQLRFLAERGRLPKTNHVHCTWRLKTRHDNGRLIFRDPRRFGGIWCYPSFDALRMERWNRLGPDALNVTARALHERLSGRKTAIKAALLNQSIIAGVGNIYADEALFAAGIHPAMPSCELGDVHVQRLAAAIRAVLRRAVKAGGSTLRDYADASGQPGWFAVEHRVYGRGGMPCSVCTNPLVQISIAQRTTVLCPSCQPAR